MISTEHKLYSHTLTSTKKVQWTNKKLKDDDDDNKHYVTLRKSKKGTRLNDPVEFNKIPTEKSLIGRLQVLPTEGCCDAEYVLSRKHKSKNKLSTKKSGQHTDLTSCAPSITINIGTSMPFHLNPTLSVYNPIRSNSNVTTNPKLMTEKWCEPEEQDKPALQEQVTASVLLPQQQVTPYLLPLQDGVTTFLQEQVTPSLLPPKERVTPSVQGKVTNLVMPQQYCESKVTYPSIPSREQRIINLETSQKNCYGGNLTYKTKKAAVPKISPFKFFFGCFGCNRKFDDEVYLPSIITRNERPTFKHRNERSTFQNRNEQPTFQPRNEQPNHNIIAYPTCTSFNSRVVKPDIGHMNIIPSRLSTITESEISSQHLSEECELQNEKKV